MTTYNCAPYIGQAVKSILNQTYKDFELLIIDDGSTDNTSELIKSFDDNRIAYHKVDHKGIGSAANYGLKIAKYDWIARMDADDISAPNRLETQIKFICSDSVRIISSWCGYFLNNKLKYINNTPVDDHIIKEKLKLHSVISHQSSLFNKKFILNELGGYSENLEAFIDYDLWLRAVNKVKFIIVPEVLVYARIRSDSVSNSKLYQKNFTFYKLQQNYFSKLDSEILDNEINGWREYFYGDKNLVRVYWVKVKMNEWDYRMILALIISFLPENFLNFFKNLRLRLRFEYILNRKKKYHGLDDTFRKLLLEVNE
jgi:glycosyltransferase involved in cell wall biosynthesis